MTICHQTLPRALKGICLSDLISLSVVVSVFCVLFVCKEWGMCKKIPNFAKLFKDIVIIRKLMAVYLEDVSRTFGEYLLIPGLTTKQCVPTNVSLKTPLVKHKAGEKSAIELNIPFVSAIMQSVSGPELAIELARNGGLSFIFGSQTIENQAEMVRKVKKFKAGFKQCLASI